MTAAVANRSLRGNAARIATVPLVLLPGTLCDARLFAPLIERLPLREVHVLSLEGGGTAPAVAARVLAQAPARFALLGFSLGGIVALEVAARAPERLLGLALLGSNARDIPVDERAARREAWTVEGTLDDHVRERLWPAYVAADARGDERLRERIAEMAATFRPAQLEDQVSIMATRADSRARLATFGRPSLVLAGSEDALCPPAWQHEMACRLPDAALALIEGAGHFVPMEAPDETAVHVAAWLARVDTAASHA